MKTKQQIGRLILQADALFLAMGGAGGLLMLDIPGIFFGRGPLTSLAAVPQAGIGFIEAHGLAFIFSIALWRAASIPFWHLSAAAVHVLLGSANLVFWRFFVSTDTLAAGYLTTSLHWGFVLLQLLVPMLSTSKPRQHERSSAPPQLMTP